MRRLLVFVPMLALPAALCAQQGGTVSPGMSRAQVESALGAPATARTVSEYTYLFYKNDCGKACGINDLVILRSDSVVDAIFRAPERHYTGQSSSPAEMRPQPPAHRSPTKPLTVKKDAAPTGQIKPPAEAHDTRPSIPANAPKMTPAPAPAAGTKTPAKPSE